MSTTTTPPAAEAQATAHQADEGFRFKAWEVVLLVLFSAIFLGSLYVYVTDFPLIRKYVFGMQDRCPAFRRHTS